MSQLEPNSLSSAPGPSDPLDSAIASVSEGCLHCGLPIPADLFSTGFCCHGCQAAYALIRGQGLDQYYDLRRRLGTGSNGARPVTTDLLDESFVDLDAPRYWQSHVTPLPQGRFQTTLRLQGIHCAACVWLLERLPQYQRGVLDARVSLVRSTLEVTWDPTQVALSEIARQLAKLGYRAGPMTSTNQERAKQKARRQELIQIGIAGACMGNVMLLALAIYAGEWSGIAEEHRQLLRGASAILGIISLLGPGATFFRGAWAAIQLRTPHMDLPVALGLGVGLLSGLWNALRGSGELYFDSLTMLVFFLLIGRALQSRQQQAACEAVDLLQQLTPGTAKRVRDGLVESVAIEAIVPGDTLEVAAGQTIPVDGIVIMGQTEVDRSLLTGESEPIPVALGDEVIAGTLNRSQVIRMRADAVGEATRLGRLVQQIHQASIRKAPIVQWSDRISGVFVTVVLGLAVLVGAAWFWIDRTVWVDRVIALLIVACPCALGLATPLAIAVGLGRAARRGVLIKGGDTLQRMVGKGILLLDKTGTITEGKLEVVHWYGSPEDLKHTAAIERMSQHPIAEAIRQAWEVRSQGEPLPEVSELQQSFGRGLRGHVTTGHAGTLDIAVGNRDFLFSLGITIDEEWDLRYQKLLTAGLSPLWVAREGQVVAMAGLGDRIRHEVPEVINRLRQAGWQIGLLSGDHPRIVARVGQELGLDPTWVWGAMLPEDKLAKVESLKADRTPVLMVGDGVNDAAALAAADVGIAVRGGAEVSLQAADVFLASGTLLGIEDVMQTGKKTLAVIRRNAKVSLGYNVLAISLASLGWLHPLAAALLMPISSLSVVTVTLLGHRARRT